MLHALRARDCDDARRLMGAALALLMVFRLLLGPALVSAPEPGLVPICTGTQVVFVALDRSAGQPGPRTSEPCPYFGFVAAPALPGEPLALPESIAFAGYLPTAIPAVPDQGPRKGNPPRGPPPLV